MSKELSQNIISQSVKGNRTAQRAMYEHYKGKMFVVCLRYADTREDAEDMLQEGFIKVFRDLHQFRGEGSIEGWVRRVIVHSSLAYIKKKRKMAFSGLSEEHIANLASDEEYVFEESTPGGLIKLMQKMPVGFRTVLNLYVLEGFSHQEIADQLGISVGTSKSQLSRAKAFMKKLVNEQFSIGD